MNKSPFGFHEGEALLKLAGYYPRIIDVLFETVQNCIDKAAERIMITVNQKSRTISVRDDGEGVTQAEFERALTSVSSTIKKHDKLGRFGLGLISPLGKCVRFTFTSTPRREPRNYLEWCFVTEDLRAQDKISGIPMRTRPELQFMRGENLQQKTAHGKVLNCVSWRTEVRIESYTPDRQINKVTFDSLREGILERFGTAMRRKKTIVIVTITDEDGSRTSQEIRAKEFEGNRLPEEEYREHDSGKTIFKLFLAKKTAKGRRGKVLIGEASNDYRLDFATFNRSLPEVCQLSDELVAALKSGFFEGEILNSKVKLHAGRKGFEANDALAGLCSTIEEWFKKHGQDHFKEAQEQRQEERYQMLGVRSMRVIEELLKHPTFEVLLKAIGSFRKGSIGEGHVEHKGKESPITAISVTASAGQEAGGEGDSEPRTKSEPEIEKIGHHPLTVVGPRGSRRVVVKSNSLGLQLMHDAMQGSDCLWALDDETGLLKINVLHPLWRQCEEHSDKTLMRFQEYLMLQALELKAAPADWSSFARLVLDELNGPYVYMLINADVLAGRVPTRPKQAVKISKAPARPKLAKARR
ncbi:MAG: ATP-binding protein [Acidobacteriaceae bacterium]